jgi:hypothetical protein
VLGSSRRLSEGRQHGVRGADGTLNLLSLAALPVGRTGYLIDQGPVIQYLSAERDLVTSSPGSRQ